MKAEVRSALVSTELHLYSILSSEWVWKGAFAAGAVLASIAVLSYLDEVGAVDAAAGAAAAGLEQAVNWFHRWTESGNAIVTFTGPASADQVCGTLASQAQSHLIPEIIDGYRLLPTPTAPDLASRCGVGFQAQKIAGALPIDGANIVQVPAGEQLNGVACFTDSCVGFQVHQACRVDPTAFAECPPPPAAAQAAAVEAGQTRLAAEAGDAKAWLVLACCGGLSFLGFGGFYALGRRGADRIHTISYVRPEPKPEKSSEIDIVKLGEAKKIIENPESYEPTAVVAAEEYLKKTIEMIVQND